MMKEFGFVLQALLWYCQGKLALPDPVLPSGMAPDGFLGYAVNMVDLDSHHIHTVTSAGHGLRETVLYCLLGELQVYKTREDMLAARACIKHGAISLDGGILKQNGVTSFGVGNVEIRFPVAENLEQPTSTNVVEVEKQIEEKKSKLKMINKAIESANKLHGKSVKRFKRTKKSMQKLLENIRSSQEQSPSPMKEGRQLVMASSSQKRKPSNKTTLPIMSLPAQDPSAPMQIDKKETSIVMKDETQIGGFAQAESIIIYTKRLQDDLHVMGMKIKQHEEKMKLLKSQKNKLQESILDLQVMLGKYHSSSTTPAAANDNHSQEETTENILQCKKSAAGILWQLKARHGNQVADLPLTKDVVGIVAMLGNVDDDILSRVLSEYLGLDTMLAIVCKTYDGVKALELYDNEGCINLNSGLHGLGTSIGRKLEGRFLVICLENIRPYAGEFVQNDPQRRLDILKPRLPNGECPPGFLGYAVNMINVDSTNLFCLTASGHGLRETLFYSLFSRLQVYKTRAEMILALPCITDGAISLDGGMMRRTGVFSLGNREDVDVKFPKLSVTSGLPESYLETQRQINEMKWRQENMEEDLKREEAQWDNAKFNFDRKKKEFIKFLADSSTYATQATQHQILGAQNRFTSS
ncbi:hypothetical protein ACLB2K_075272 [Fragaria x ananassa]